MIAGIQHRQQGGGDRRQARGRNADARALRAFERHQRFLQRLGGRGAVAAILELAAMGVQVLRRRIEHGGAMDHRRIDETLSAPRCRGLRSPAWFRPLRVRSSGACSGNLMRLPPPKDLLPQPRPVKSPPGGGFGLGYVNNRTQKTAVNPLTRLASRSVMRRELFSRRTLRGLPRPSIHRLTRLHVKLPVGLAFAAGDHRVGPSAQAMKSKRSRTTLERLCHETRIPGSYPCSCRRLSRPRPPPRKRSRRSRTGACCPAA